jgi:hypothetical protein
MFLEYMAKRRDKPPDDLQRAAGSRTRFDVIVNKSHVAILSIRTFASAANNNDQQNHKELVCGCRRVKGDN